MNNIVEPTIEHYNNYASRAEREGFEGFIDYYMIGCVHGDDGKDYYVTICVGKSDAGVTATLSGDTSRKDRYDFGRLSISKESVGYFTTPNKKIIQKGEKPEIEIVAVEPVGGLKIEDSSSTLTAKLKDFDFILSPPGSCRARYQGKDALLDLNFQSQGIPFWFNQGKEEGARLSPSNLLWGLENFGDIEGSLTIEGKIIQVKGGGIFEHCVTEHTSWMEFIWLDWMWFLSDQMYGLIMEVQGGGYKDGGIYLREEEEYLIIRDFEIDHPQWAFSTAFRMDFPIAYSARAHTDKGTLFIEGDLLRSQPFTYGAKYRRAVTIIGSDLQVGWKGEFTYTDGRTITLTNGKGGNEIIATYNFVQANV